MYDAAVELMREYAPDLLPERERVRLGLAAAPAPAAAVTSMIRGLDLDEFLAQARTGVPWLVQDLVTKRGITVFAGDPRSFKTTAAVQLMFAVADGGTWLGREVQAAGAVAYVAEEGAPHGIAAMYEAYRGAGPLSHRFLTFHLQGLSPTRREAWAQLEQQLREADVQLLVVDTVARTMEGEENSADAMRDYLNGFASLLRNGMTIVLIHHLNKYGEGRIGRRLRGSGVLWGGVDGTLGFTRKIEGGQALNEGTIDVESKYAEPQRIAFLYDPAHGIQPGWAPPRCTPDGIAATIAEMEPDQGAIPFGLLHGRYPDVGEDRLRTMLNQAVDRGLVRREGAGRSTAYRAVREQRAVFGIEELTE